MLDLEQHLQTFLLLYRPDNIWPCTVAIAILEGEVEEACTGHKDPVFV